MATSVQVQKPLADPVDQAADPGPNNLRRVLLQGSSALGMATICERGFGFLANVLAARIGGAAVFGAYSVSLTTANSIATYAGAGIGATANRFSGDFPYGQPGYKALLRVLTISSLASTILAASFLFLTAGLVAKFMNNVALTPLLQWAALSAGALILLECLRGLFVGQRRFAALLCLSLLVGIGMLVSLPLAASRGPQRMIAVQALVVFAAIATCVVFARRLRFAAAAHDDEAGPRLGGVARFGLTQVASMIGVNAAGWWIATLLARGDTTLVQMGYYSVALQFRNLCGMPSLLISQIAFAQLTEKGGESYGGPEYVAVVSTFAATLLSLIAGTIAAAALPLVISTLYGHAFTGATFAATIAIATAMVHMSSGPAGARLTIVSLRVTTIINAFWAALVIAAGAFYVPQGGAVAATSIFLAAHITSALLVLFALFKFADPSDYLAWLSIPSVLTALMFTALGWLRYSGYASLWVSIAMVLTGVAMMLATFQLGRRGGVLRADASVAELCGQSFCYLISRVKHFKRGDRA